MEKIVKRLFLSGCAIFALAVSLMSVGTYAIGEFAQGKTGEVDKTPTEEGNAQCREYIDPTDPIVSNLCRNLDNAPSAESTFTLNVAKSIILTNVTGVNIAQGLTTEVNEGDISATVYANGQFTIKLSAEQPNLMHDVTGDTTNFIPAIEAGANVVKGTNGWGVKKLENTAADGTATEAGSYTGITGTPTTFYTSPTKVATSEESAGITAKFPVGIGISTALQSGEYSTQVTVTASPEL